MSFVMLSGAIGAGATALGASAAVASAIGAIGAGAIGGAGLGALGSAITGGDVGRGAMFGALGGGITGGLGEGISSLLGAAGETAETASPAVMTAAEQQVGVDALGPLSEVPNLSTVGGEVGNQAITPMLDSQGMPITSGAGQMLARSDIPVQDLFSTTQGYTAPADIQAQIQQQAQNAAVAQTETQAQQLNQQLGLNAPTGAQQGIPKTAAPSTGVGGFLKDNPWVLPAGMMAMPVLSNMIGPNYNVPSQPTYSGPLSKIKYDPSQYTPNTVVPQVYTPRYAEGGIASAVTHPNLNFMDGGSYPMSQQDPMVFNKPTQMPAGAQEVAAQYEVKTNPITGEPVAKFAGGGMTNMGMFGGFLGRVRPATPAPPPFNPNTMAAKYSAAAYQSRPTPAANTNIYRPRYMEGGLAGLNVGGKLVKGQGDGMDDRIHANIDGRQPARLSDSEFVIPADVVSHLGNGSTDAGAKKLYAMMDRVRQARTGKKKQAPEIAANRYMPA